MIPQIVRGVIADTSFRQICGSTIFKMTGSLQGLLVAYNGKHVKDTGLQTPKMVFEHVNTLTPASMLGVIVYNAQCHEQKKKLIQDVKPDVTVQIGGYAPCWVSSSGDIGVKQNVFEGSMMLIDINESAFMNSEKLVKDRVYTSEKKFMSFAAVSSTVEKRLLAQSNSLFRVANANELKNALVDMKTGTTLSLPERKTYSFTIAPVRFFSDFKFM